MIIVNKYGVVLSKSERLFEVEAVLNPAVILHENKIYMFYRAVAKNNFSSIGLCLFKSPLEIEHRCEIPVIFPQNEYEQQGTEDPRIVKIDNVFYLSYCAFDGLNARGAIAISQDLELWQKQGIIVPQVAYGSFKQMAETNQKLNEKYYRYNEHENVKERDGKKVLVWDKNVVFFPRRINEKLVFLHRIKPDIQLVSIDNLSDLTEEFWQNYLMRFQDSIVLSPKYKHEISYIGGGCPPIETHEGWLVIYHGVYDAASGFVYCACAALLDLENPLKEIARLPYPLFKPEFDYELKGDVNNVCFPSGAIVQNDTLFIYYGAADKAIACASVSLTDLLLKLMQNQK
jgi:predicted GH43/DUF377 family glycosyl hydrolase